MSFSHVSVGFGLLATLAKLGAAEVKLGGDEMVFLGTGKTGQTFQPAPEYGLGPIPSSLDGFDFWRQSHVVQVYPAGTDLEITCENPAVGGSGGLCEFFVSFHNCKACTGAGIHGGLVAALKAEGWGNTQCAPTFSIGATTGLKTQTFRKQLNNGETATVRTTSPLSHLVVSRRKATVNCPERFSDAASCNGAYACLWDLPSASCGSAFCPAPVGPHPPAPCTCAAGL